MRCKEECPNILEGRRTMGNPQVSVIVPIYKVELYLDQCIQSLVNQTHEDIEIILIDDGSPDKCGEICDSYAAQYDAIKVIHQHNLGVSVVRNVGIETATGEWIMFVDGDDWVEPDMVEKMLDAVAGLDCDLCFCGAFLDTKIGTTSNMSSLKKIRYALENNSTLSIEALKKVQNMYLSSSWAKLYKRDFIIEKDLKFVNGLSRSQDIIFNLYYFQFAPNAAFCYYPLYHYRLSNSSTSNGYRDDAMSAIEMFLSEMYQFAERYPNNGLSQDCYFAYSMTRLCNLSVSHIAHNDNPQTISERIKQIKLLSSDEPYFTALQKGKLQLIPKNYQLVIIILRCRLYVLFYWICRLRFLFKSKKNQS